jgi:colicin import membrane protein
MVGSGSAPTISLRERSLRLDGPEEKLSKWVFFSLFTHGGLIALLFIMPWLPSRKAPSYPIYTVDLVGGEKIGGMNFGTELPKPASKPAPQKTETETAPPAPKEKSEPKKEKAEKKPIAEKTKAAPVLPENKLAMKEPVKKEAAKKEVKETKREAANGATSEESAADRVRERLIQSAVERAKNRTENSPKSGGRGEVISSGPGEGEGAAALGPGGRGGGVVKGMDFIVYQNRMLSTIKDNWAWVGQRSNLRVVVHFNIKDTGEVVGLRIVQPSGDPSYDESVLRAVKKSSPLPAPPETVRQDFADVELSFRPKDLGA